MDEKILSEDSCLICSKIKNSNATITRIQLADGVSCFLVSFKEKISIPGHFMLARGLDKFGSELAESLLNEDVAKKFLDG